MRLCFRGPWFPWRTWRTWRTSICTSPPAIRTAVKGQRVARACFVKPIGLLFVKPIGFTRVEVQS